jgi:hypothetical protein
MGFNSALMGNLDSSGPGEGPTIEFCDHGNEILYSMNIKYF